MKVGYTEFSFGYAFTENLIRSSTTAPVGAPVFPNLVQEGQWGFDVRIDFPAVPLFFQYKLPELMRKGTAFEIAKWHCQGLSIPFFRINLMRRDLSRQHERLIQLEQKYPQSVFYAAPCVATIRDFDQAYNSASIAQQSMFFSPSDIGSLPDDRAHTIAYKAGLSTAFYLSDPKPIVALTFDKLISFITHRFDQHEFVRIESTAREIRETLLELASPPIRAAEQLINQRVLAKRVQPATVAPRPPEMERILVDILVAVEVARIDFGLDRSFHYGNAQTADPIHINRLMVVSY